MIPSLRVVLQFACTQTEACRPVRVEITRRDVSMHTVLVLLALGNLLEHEPHARDPFGRAATHTLRVLAEHAIVSGGLPEGGERLQAITVERDGACRRHALPFLGLRPPRACWSG